MKQNGAAHILVVDDVQSIRLAVCKHLAQEFEVIAASSATDALKMCATIKLIY